MDAHKLAQKLLKLPVSSVALPSEYAVREVMLGAYRLLKALCDCFKVTQLALIPQIPKIIGHIELKLVPVQRLKPDQTSGLASCRSRYCRSRPCCACSGLQSIGFRVSLSCYRSDLVL